MQLELFVMLPSGGLGGSLGNTSAPLLGMMVVFAVHLFICRRTFPQSSSVGSSSESFFPPLDKEPMDRTRRENPPTKSESATPSDWADRFLDRTNWIVLICGFSSDWMLIRLFNFVIESSVVLVTSGGRNGGGGN